MTEELTLGDVPLNLNEVSDLAAVKSVKVSYAPDLKDLSPLQALNNLETLYINLGAASFPDFSPLHPLKKLRSLEIYCYRRESWEEGPSPGFNQLRSLAGLSQLQSLTLNTGTGAEGTDLSPIAALNELKCLSLCIQPLAPNAPALDFSALAKLAGLEEFSVGFTECKSFSFLKSLAKIQKIDLSLDKKCDLTAVGEAFTLLELTLQANFQALPDLTQLKQLKSLHLTDGCSRLKNIEGIRGLTNLETLTLNITTKSQLQPLSTLTGLKKLNLRNGNYESSKVPLDTSLLRPLAEIESLGIVGMRGVNLEFIEAMPQLQSVYLGGCQVGDFTPLIKAPALTELILKNNSEPDQETQRQIQAAHPKMKYSASTVDYWGN
ncbi:MAG: hypothetical protein P1V97_08840 [Planctomycetota bacterium]|nr:hypothetical protein [Planctomycetota bacterium]